MNTAAIRRKNGILRRQYDFRGVDDIPSEFSTSVSTSMQSTTIDEVVKAFAALQDVARQASEFTSVGSSGRPINPVHDYDTWVRTDVPIAAVVGAIVAL